MAIWFCGPTGSATTGNGTSGAPCSLNRILGNVAGQSFPVAGDTVRMMPGRYTGPKTVNINSSGSPITFIPDSDADVIFDGANSAVAGGGVTAITGWSLVPNAGAGAGVRVYGTGNSGTSWPWVYQVTGQSGILSVWADDYIAGTSGTVKSPGTDNWWWVGLGDMRVYNLDDKNTGFNIHGVVGGVSTDNGHDDTDGYKSRIEDSHDWRAQFKNEGSTLYARFHLSGGTLPGLVYASSTNSPAFSAIGKNNIVFDGGVNRRFKFYRWRRAFQLENGSGWQIKNCEMRWMQAEGIHMLGFTNSIIDRCLILGGNYWEHTYGNIFLQNTTSTEVSNCEMAYGGHQGIALNGSSGCWIHNNEIRHQNGYGVYSEGGINILIEHNYIHDSGYIDRMLLHKTPHGGFDILKGASNFWVRRNEVLRCGTGWWKGGDGHDNCQIYNNTFHLCEYAGFFIDDGQNTEAGKTFGNIIQNNLVDRTVGYAGSPGTFTPRALWYALYNNATNSGHNNDFRNNSFYTPAAAAGGADQITLGSYDPSNGAPQYPLTLHTVAEIQGGGAPSWMTGNCASNIATDPLLENGAIGDFDLGVGSPCINVGSQSALELQPTVIGVVRVDYPAVQGGTVDIGARESGGGGGGGGNTAPTANLTSNVISGACPLTVNFIANGSDAETVDASLQYAWVFGDPNATSGNTVSGTGKVTYDARTFVYNHPGVYVAQVTITDGGGLTITQTRTITVSSPRGGTLLASTVGNSITSYGGGSIPAPGTQTPEKCYNQLWLSNGANLQNDSFSQSGLVSSPGAPQGVLRQFASAQTVTRIRVSGYRWDSNREHVLVIETSTNGSTWSAVHPGSATWKTLVGTGNEFTEVDFAPRTLITHVRVTENSNSESNNFMTIWEIQIYTDTGGGGGGGENTWTPVAAFDSYNTDPVAPFGPNKVIDGTGPDAGLPQNRWLKGPIVTDGTWIGVDLGQNRSLKTFLTAFWKPASIVYRYDIDTSTDKVTWTNRVSNATSATTAYTTNTLGGAVSARYWRVKFRPTSSTPCASCIEMQVRDF